jgi:hypothetical protein
MAGRITKTTYSKTAGSTNSQATRLLRSQRFRRSPSNGKRVPLSELSMARFDDPVMALRDVENDSRPVQHRPAGAAASELSAIRTSRREPYA